MKRIIAAFLLLACLALSACQTNNSAPSTSPSSDPSPTPSAKVSGLNIQSPWVYVDSEAVLLTIGDYEIYGYEFSYFYMTSINMYSRSSEDVQNLDISKSLAKQTNSEGTSWQDFFTDVTKDDIHHIYALYGEALKHNVTLTAEDKASKQALIDDLSEYAKEEKTSLDDLLVKFFCAGLTQDRLESILDRYLLSVRYEEELLDSLEPTDQEIENYYEQHKSEDDVPKGNVVSVRHIMTEDLDAAQKLYDEWKAGAKTEQSFVELAQASSMDNSVYDNNGLLEDVRLGSVGGAFDDWCFDPSRVPSDTTVVESDYGAHVIYFVASGGPAWQIWAKNLLTEDAYGAILDDLLSEYPLKNA